MPVIIRAQPISMVDVKLLLNDNFQRPFGSVSIIPGLVDGQHFTVICDDEFMRSRQELSVSVVTINLTLV